MTLSAFPASARRDGAIRRVCDQSGVAAVEFAIVVPFLLLLFIGVYQISDVMLAYQKVTKTARTLADLTSQYTAVSTENITTILNASRQVLAPYDVSASKLVISQISIDAVGNATVSWSEGFNTPKYTQGATFHVPAQYRQNGKTIIVADVTYVYTPIIAPAMFGSMILKEQITMFPRKSTTITKS